MPKTTIYAQPLQPREISVTVVFCVNPAKLRKIGLDNTEQLSTVIEQLVDEQYGLARSQLIEAIKAYIDIDQRLIDKTRN